MFEIGVEEEHEALVNYLVAKGIGGSAEFRFGRGESIEEGKQEEEDDDDEDEDDNTGDAMEENCP